MCSTINNTGPIKQSQAAEIFIGNLPEITLFQVFKYALQGAGASVPQTLSLVCKKWRATISSPGWNVILFDIAKSHFKDATARRLLPFFGIGVSKMPLTVPEARIHLTKVARIIEIVVKSNPWFRDHRSDLTKMLPHWVSRLSNERFSLVTSRNLYFLNKFFNFIYEWNVRKIFIRYVDRPGANSLMDFYTSDLNDQPINGARLICKDRARIDTWLDKNKDTILDLQLNPSSIDRPLTCIPAEIFLCQKLRSLELKGNVLFSVPEDLELCTALKRLSISTQHLQMPIPQGLLSKKDLVIEQIASTNC